MLFAADSYAVLAYDVSRRLIWNKGAGAEITRFVSYADNILTLEIEVEMSGLLETVQIRTDVESVADRRYLDVLFGVLESHPEVERIEPGLTDEEVQAVQHTFKFWFPPDLRGLLQFAVPVGKLFPNWRDPGGADLQARFDWPFEGIRFDVEQSGFWLQEWGSRPRDAAARMAVVRNAMDETPRLVPVCGHRYIPALQCRAGNPVFSVYHTDIIYYGYDLADYFHHEFGVPLPEWAAKEPPQIEFWTDSLRWRGE